MRVRHRGRIESRLSLRSAGLRALRACGAGLYQPGPFDQVVDLRRLVAQLVEREAVRKAVEHRLDPVARGFRHEGGVAREAIARLAAAGVRAPAFGAGAE